jgi:predicted  nucleic acid-binding Zn-ribbon protein
MSRSKTLFQLQQYDSEIDSSNQRIKEIDAILADQEDLIKAQKEQDKTEKDLQTKQNLLQSAEHQVEDQNLKITQNENKLYSGVITNPKELEDLQLESSSLKKYLEVLEERQLEAMLEVEKAQEIYDQAFLIYKELADIKAALSLDLNAEKNTLINKVDTLSNQKISFLETADIPDIETYNSLRKALGGIAVTQMISGSCSSCGSNIPSAIEQEAKSPGKISVCPACKRILHPKSP